MVNLKGKKIALIGGAGFIGHNLALELKRQNADVYIIDGLQVNNLLAFSSTEKQIQNKDLYLKFLNQRLDLLRASNIPLHVEDARDYHLLSRTLTAIKPQIIVLLAAVAHSGQSNKDPFSTFDHSFRSLENALDWARGNAEHFIYFSSSMVYGNFNEPFVDEETICNPIGIYGALKFGGEKLVIAYNQVFNLPYTIIRPSALYGERCVSQRVIQLFIENAIQRLDIKVNGDPKERLDFTYINDLVDGVVKVIENENSRGEIFNLTYGNACSISEVVDILFKHFPEMKVQYLHKDALMPQRGTLSVEKAKKLICYNPKYPLEKGIVRYIEWYRSNKFFG